MKGMVLAAGLGTRLAPLTDFLPKPMFNVCNIPMIDFALQRLDFLKIDDVAVNLHHLPDAIRDYLKPGTRFGQRVTFSEEPNILGTGGGIKAVREWVGQNLLVVTNGDTLMMSAVEPVLEDHLASDALATLALVPVRNPGRFSPVAVDETGSVVDVGGRLKERDVAALGVFAGFHILNPSIFDRMPDRDHFCIVQDVYLPLIKQRPGAVRAMMVPGEFYDMGTPMDYLAANQSILATHIHPDSPFVAGYRHLGDNVYVGKGVSLGRGVNLRGPCIVGDNVRIDGGSEIGPVAAIGKGAYLGAWSRIYGTVVWPDALLHGGGLHTNSIVYDRETFFVGPPSDE